MPSSRHWAGATDMESANDNLRAEELEPWQPSESQRRVLELARAFMESGTVNPTPTPFLNRFQAD